MPVLVERSGPHGIAGAATAALFLGAVTGELSSPSLMTRWRSTRLLVGGLLVTSITSLVYVLPHIGIGVMIAAAYLRGIGMGVAIVVAVALITDLAPPHRRGASIGYFGLALSLPGVVVPSIGVFLLAAGRTEVAAVVAAVCGLLGAAAALRLPDRSRHVIAASSNLIGALRRPGLLLVMAGFVLTSCSFGGALTFVPVALPLNGLGSAAAFLFVSGGARALTRWLAGLLGDRVPARTVLLGGTVVTLAGLVGLALHTGPLVVLAAAAIYGGGYGAVQTSSFLAMTERGTARDVGAISALWNSGIDMGSSLGGTLVGLAAAHYGYGLAGWVLPLVVGASLPLLLWPAPAAGKGPQAKPAEGYAIKG